MIRRTIDRLKERPHEDRRAIASMAAFAVVGILLLGWVISFIARVGSIAANPSQQAAAASSTDAVVE